jgi:hypothetical protein
MTFRIQGSTQLPPSIQQKETESAEPQRPRDPNEGGKRTGPSNNTERTAPSAQPPNPAAEMQFEAHTLAVDLNARLDNANGGNSNPPDSSAYLQIELENCLISNFKSDPPKTDQKD